MRETSKKVVAGVSTSMIRLAEPAPEELARDAERTHLSGQHGPAH